MADFDLSALDVVDGAVPFVLRHPATDDPLPAIDGSDLTLQVLGVESDEYHRAQDEFIGKSIGRNGKVKAMTAQQRRQRSIALLSAVVVGWTPFTLDGEAFEYSAGHAQVLLTRFSFALDQLDAFLGDRANFLKS